MLRIYPKSNREMNWMRLSMRLVKCQRDRKEDNIGDNIADERANKDRDKIIQIIRGYFWDRVKVIIGLSLCGLILSGCGTIYPYPRSYILAEEKMEITLEPSESELAETEIPVSPRSP